MTRTASITAALALALTAPVALGASQKTYSASLSGGKEVPKVTTKGSGTATFKLAADGRSISYKLTYKKLSSATLFAHIHAGKAGASGNVIVSLATKSFSSGLRGTIRAKDLPKTGRYTTISKLAAALGNASTYTNVHTKMHGGGEIRGQNTLAK